MLRKLSASLLLVLFGMSAANADMTLNFAGPGGGETSATAKFTLIDSTHLEIILTNTSTAKSGSDDSNNILTSIGFNLPGAMTITGGSAYVGVGSTAWYSDTVYGAGTDVSSEFGYGHHAGWQTGAYSSLLDFVSSNNAHATKMGSGNLDGPNGLNGPQGGMWSSSFGYPSGLGVVRNSTRFVLTLSGGTLTTLNFLDDGVAVEWGSDYRFGGATAVPVPGAVLLAAVGLPVVTRLRRAMSA